MRYYQTFLTMAILTMVLLLGACGPAANSQAAPGVQVPQIIIKAADYSFEAPAQIQAGLVSLISENNGQEPHHAQLARLNDGVTVEQFQTTLQKNPFEAFSLVTWAGGPGAVDPGGQQQVTVELSPGDYLILCFVPGHDGMLHVAKGMIGAVEVVASNGQASPAKPQAQATIKLLDFSFQVPAEIKAGRQIWQVVNEGQQFHEIALIKLAEGKTMEDVAAFMQAPHGQPPFMNAGGLQAIDPGETGWLHLDLTPGNYVAVCHIPDPASGHSHEELGMVIPFTVK